jgi:hypothetical protein
MWMVAVLAALCIWSIWFGLFAEIPHAFAQHGGKRDTPAPRLGACVPSTSNGSTGWL